MFTNKSKIISFEKVSDNIENRLKGWGGKNLSSASRNVMTKTVLETIHFYIISSFILPKEITKRSTSIVRDYWWGKNMKKKGFYIKA